MDNITRSERSRNAALEAALTIISRDGPGRLTLDAIARESGISKGGVTHQFPTKEAVVKALLDRRAAFINEFTSDYMIRFDGASHPLLLAQIERLREAINTKSSFNLAVLGALVHEPSLLSDIRDKNIEKIEAIKGEASDAELATLRWIAAWGLALTDMLGVSPFSDDAREALFDRLLDERAWQR